MSHDRNTAPDATGVQPGDAPRIVYEGRYQRMVVRGTWEYSERTHAGGLAAIIIAVTPEDRVLFVEQFRVPLQARTIEMPAWSATLTPARRSNGPRSVNWKKRPAGPPTTPKC